MVAVPTAPGQVTRARTIGNHQPGASKQTCQPVERQFTTTILCGPLHGLEDGIDRRLSILNPNHDDMVTLTLQGIAYGCKLMGGPPPAWIGGTGMQDNNPTLCYWHLLARLRQVLWGDSDDGFKHYGRRANQTYNF